MAVRFLHAADLHLDTPFEGLSRVSPALQASLVDASLLAFDALIDVAVRDGVDFVVFAGDVYDGAERGVRAQLRLLAGARRLEAAGIPLFVAHGNHDPIDEGWSAIRKWPGNVHIFPSDGVAVHALVARDGTAVTVSGISYPRRDMRESLCQHFPEPPGAGFHVAVLHTNVGSIGEHASYSPSRLEDLAVGRYDYWALGHIHRRAVLRAFAPAIVYPGNLQGRSFKSSELGPKGAVRVDARPGAVEVRFVDLAPVRFEHVVLDASSCEDVGQVAEGLLEAARPLAEGVSRVVIRAQVVGSTPACEALQRADATEVLARSLEDALPSVFWADLRIEVRPPIDLDTLAGRGDLLGQLADEMLALDDGDLRALLSQEEGARPLLDTLDAGALRAAARRAAELAVALLGEEA